MPTVNVSARAACALPDFRRDQSGPVMTC